MKGGGEVIRSVGPSQLRRLRELGFTLSDISRESGLRKADLSRYIHGHKSPRSRISKIIDNTYRRLKTKNLLMSATTVNGYVRVLINQNQTTTVKFCKEVLGIGERTYESYFHQGSTIPKEILQRLLSVSGQSQEERQHFLYLYVDIDRVEPVKQKGDSSARGCPFAEWIKTYRKNYSLSTEDLGELTLYSSERIRGLEAGLYGDGRVNPQIITRFLDRLTLTKEERSDLWEIFKQSWDFKL